MKYETTMNDLQKAMTNHIPVINTFKESAKRSLNTAHGANNTSIKIFVALCILKDDQFNTRLKAPLFDDIFNKVMNIIDTSIHDALLYLNYVIQTTSSSAAMFEELNILNLTSTHEILHDIAYAMSETIVRTLEEK